MFYVPANTVSIGYMGVGFYRPKDPTNSIKVLKEERYKGKHTKHKQQNTHVTYTYTIIHIERMHI